MLIREGFPVGDYQILSNKVIGRGSFSKVYPGAKNKSIFDGASAPDKVAIKVICLSDISKMQDRLKYEIEVMQTLDHENVICMRDVVYLEDNVFLILDFCKNGDFHKFLNGRPLKSKYALFYLKQMAQGLHYLYDRSIIHRDLKPQNLLLDDSYTLKITDFGFAKYFDQGGMSETICGTPLYMAPEIMKFKKYSIKSDLWSVGVILYEMVVGRTPYKAQNHMELLHRINTEGVIIPIYLEVDEKCRQLIRGLLQKNPKDRMNWSQFFNHPWLLGGIGGMDISILASPHSFKDSFIVKNKQFQGENTECGNFTTLLDNPSIKKGNIIQIIDNYDSTTPFPLIQNEHIQNEHIQNEHIQKKHIQKKHIDHIENEDDFDINIAIVEDSDSSEYYSVDDTWVTEELSLSDDDADIIIESGIQEIIHKRPQTSPIAIKRQTSIGMRYSQGRIVSEEVGNYSLQNKRELFLPIAGRTPKKDNGFVVVETPKEYDIVSDILKNERRNLSESLMDYMGDTYCYLRSFWKE